jgi:hypothetical protein
LVLEPFPFKRNRLCDLRDAPLSGPLKAPRGLVAFFDLIPSERKRLVL